MREVPKQRPADAEARLRRYQAAIASGVDPEALLEVINQAQAERSAVRKEIENAPAVARVTEADIHAMIDSLGDAGATLADARPAGLGLLDQALPWKPDTNQKNRPSV